ncbi:extracellular matrix protein 2-like isoform X2 [Ambystoma mexicanum]|uniref:extracellular matrix protein 2-like isoform X2 n=1 Tax=Ambystoma mexicanum TaxID=8296 RepID=UPI0037E71D24
MRLLCAVLLLALWGSPCDGWPSKTPNRGSGPKQEASLTSRSQGKGPEVKTSRPVRRVAKANPPKHRHPDLVHVAGRGQCLVNGMAMYDGAAWAPDPCTMCICDLGTQVCEVTDCRAIKCPLGSLRIPPGRCCPVCTEPGATRPTFVNMTGGHSHATSKSEKKDAHKDKVQKERNVLEDSLSEKKTVGQSSSKKKKEAPQKHQDGTVDKRGVVPVKNLKVLMAKKEANDKKPEGARPTRQATAAGQATAPTEGPQRDEKKDLGGKRPVSDRHSKEKPQRKNTLDFVGSEKDSHLGLEAEKNKNVSEGAGQDSSSGPLSHGSNAPMPAIEKYMPSLPSNCLLAESTIACANTKMKRLPELRDPGLKTLYLAENDIAHLPADAFAGLPNLEWLDLSKNKLDDDGVHIDAFKNLTKLKRLNLDGNRLTAIPLLPPLLQELKMNDNAIQGLQRHSFRGLYKLLTLELEGNHFHDGNVFPMSFKPLRSLIYLRLDRNRFRAVPSGLPASLQELHLDSNRIEQVSEGLLNKTLNLSVLVLSNNRLQEDRIAMRAWIDLPKLESLDLSYNRLVHVPSFLPRGLRQLTLHHNQIERIPGYVFAHMKPGLEFLHLSHNHLRDDGIHATSFLGLYKSLAELLLDNNHLHSVPRGLLNLKALQVLRLSFNKIRSQLQGPIPTPANS